MTNLLSMLTVWYLQFYQPMVLSSLVVSFIPVAIASLQSHGDRNNINSNTNPGIVRNLFLSICRTVVVLALAVVVNVLLKVSQSLSLMISFYQQREDFSGTVFIYVIKNKNLKLLPRIVMVCSVIKFRERVLDGFANFLVTMRISNCSPIKKIFRPVCSTFIYKWTIDVIY
jgi:hypothetical protein